MNFFKWLKSLFTETKPVETKPVETKPVETKPVETKPVETKPVETKPVETKPKTPVKKTKIALIIGHTKKSQGAVNYKGETEFSFNSRIAEKVKKIFEIKYPTKELKLFFRDEGYYSTAVVAVGKAVGKWGAKISMELHFNSFKQLAYGCEILVWEGAKDADKTIKLADEITDRMAKKFNLKERNSHKYKDGKVGDGVKILPSKERGALNIKACNDEGVVHAMLIEPCFANLESSESKAIFENEDAYAEFLAEELANIDV
jgi:N-acetylmuramoyl-L-alanine amidase